MSDSQPQARESGLPNEPTRSSIRLIISITATSTVAWLASLPGVSLAYPYNTYEVTVALLDTVVSEDAQALPLSASKTRMFSQIKAGRMFDSDTGKQIVVGSRFLIDLGVDSLESVPGQVLAVAAVQDGPTAAA